MNLKRPRLYFLTIVILVVPFAVVRAQENGGDDTDLGKMLKEAQEMGKEADEMQKANPAAPEKKKTMADLEAESKAELSRVEAQEKKEKEQLEAALKKQLAEPRPAALPPWTPKTPHFTATGPAVKKIIDDEVKIVQTGTSTLTPKELGDTWEAAATAAGNLNHTRNNISSNGNITTIMFLSTRTSPEERVEMEARWAPEKKSTQVEISSALPKPEIESD